MKNIARFIAVLALLVSIGGFANAQSVQEQINAAMAAGDFDTVKSLVEANPALADQVSADLLKMVQDNLTSDPAKAALAMAAVESIVQYVTPAGAGAIAAAIGDVMEKIAENNLLGGDNGAAYAGMMESAGNIAKSPVISAAAPQLLAQIESVGGDVQLAQSPGNKPNGPPNNKPSHHKKGSKD